MDRILVAGLIGCCAVLGCSTPPRLQPPNQLGTTARKPIARSTATRSQAMEVQPPAVVRVVQNENPDGDTKPPLNVPPAPAEDPNAKPKPEDYENIDPPSLVLDQPDPSDSIYLPDVVSSVHGTFPLIEAAVQELTITDGKVLAAWGAFDLKLKGQSESAPTGFYKTYRNSAGFVQPTYGGGEVFGGYRIGRGFFEPWYLERQTNDGGEFKAGVRVPLARNREIDARRAELWRAGYDRQLAQPEIRGQLIQFVRDASITYWMWVAAGQKYQIGKSALDLSLDRNEAFQKQLKAGDIGLPKLRDNERSIASRQAKLIDLARKLEQTAVKLSLFYRTPDGQPVVPSSDQLPNFPEPVAVDPDFQSGDIEIALAARPELEALDITRERVNVDAAEASNDLLPNIDAQVTSGQDLGEPTSSKRDKSRFELELGLYFDMPLQRRKGYGKLQSAQGKLAQLAAKRRFTTDKIAAEVQAIYVAMMTAYDRVTKTREARIGAEYLAAVERRKYELGASDLLLSVFQREQIAIEAANAEVDALLDYYIARADYAAALAYEWVNRQAEPIAEGDPLCPTPAMFPAE